jgi:D-3-phosphoglycerate dehydrogenase
MLSDYELVFAGDMPSEQKIIDCCAAHNPVAIILRYSKVGAAAMDAAPALKVISKHGSGTDTIDKQAAAERGIAVVAAAGANAAAVAEHALALMLACAKQVVHLDKRMHTGHWDKATHKSIELEGRVLGLVGMGAIGQRFARMAQAMGMQVLGFDPFAKTFPPAVNAVSLSHVLAQADVLSLHCPLTADNKNMLNAETLRQCKDGVIIVNTARGGLIDEPALLAALNSGKVHSAGLDSFAVEPMTAPHIFHGHPRIVLSPHIGGVSLDAYVKMGVGAAENALAVLRQ